MLFIRANTHFNIHTIPSIQYPSVHISIILHLPAHTLALVALICLSTGQCTNNHPVHCSGIPALVPGDAMCIAGMAMLGSALLFTGCMPSCVLMQHFLTKNHNKPCQAGLHHLCSTCQGLFSISAMSIRKFPFWDNLWNSVHVPLITYGQHSV